MTNDGKASQLKSLPWNLAELNIRSPKALNSHKYAKTVYEQENFYYIKIITVRNLHKK